MSLFRRSAPQREARAWPPIPLPSDDASVLGVSARTADEAMRHATVWGCVSLLADTVSTLPVDVFRPTPSGRDQLPTPTLLQRPSPYASPSVWLWQAVASLLTHGNAYGLVTATQGGWPSQVVWLDPAKVQVVNRDGLVTYVVGGRPVDAATIVHIPAFVLPGAVCGLAPIAVFRRSIELGLSAEEFGAGWFREGGVPSALLKTDQAIDSTQAEDFKQRWRQSVGRRRGVAVMGSGLEYQPISVPAEESQFLQTIQANATTVCQIFRVPPEMLGVAASGSSVTYANREQRSIDFLTFSLSPWLVRLEEALTALLPRPQFVKFNVDALLRTDTLTRYQAHSLALKDGWRSRNEVRQLEDLTPIPGGNDYVIGGAPQQQTLPGIGGNP